MILTPPAWLTKRGGSLKLGSDGTTWFVLIEDQPIYSLTLVPVEGKYACMIRQTNSGRRIAGTATFPTEKEAFQSGLEELRKHLGWA